MRPPRLRIGLIALDQWLGGVVYTHNLLRALSRLPSAERPHVTLFCRTHTGLFDEVAPLADRVVVFQSWMDKAFAGSRFETTARRAHAIVSGVLLHESAPELAHAVDREKVQAVFPVGSHFTNRLPCPIAWIPDLQHRDLPHLASGLRSAIRDSRFASILGDPTRHVVFSSRCSLEDAIRAYGKPKANIHILRFASVPTSSWFLDPATAIAKYQVPAHYFIICNQFWKHKDHLTAFRAIARLMHQGLKVHLVCTGPTWDNRNPGYFPSLKSEINKLGIEQQVQILGTIPRLDQVGLIRGSQAVLQPSRFEGWSTVIEDARALGKPVIASDFRVHLEQAPDGSSFFRVGDDDDLAQAIAGFLQAEHTVTGPSSSHEHLVVEFARTFLGIVEAARSSAAPVISAKAMAS
ncbi:MAG TPA: glycosyltransferase family 1 protein [Terriglobales bacterium]|nr:glycosyltransferase family 1 protein [Terriglobales bacterium]